MGLCAVATRASQVAWRHGRALHYARCTPAPAPAPADEATMPSAPQGSSHAAGAQRECSRYVGRQWWRRCNGAQQAGGAQVQARAAGSSFHATIIPALLPLPLPGASCRHHSACILLAAVAATRLCRQLPTLPAYLRRWPPHGWELWQLNARRTTAASSTEAASCAQRAHACHPLHAGRLLAACMQSNTWKHDMMQQAPATACLL